MSPFVRKSPRCTARNTAPTCPRIAWRLLVTFLIGVAIVLAIVLIVKLYAL